ncbi:hypothetical protein HRM2_20240 [Desulforapulum autotrophicum HRM2]|uniref:Ice-binding protein C-terminal domain-containing protein n=1 Tax=Desulforapulum autotrophicum (strain ATCC 43914 / DSM 3382 / VKM B-1955 / HRM2) TaxID=177437 RepID=C0QCP8_DESAH|nr:PEP-CTERM sorting domain-containing protein [Desulforapulum autotrophicum]ACN15125.1 hypothetical protein HRM2_20240 [Desulforapulum autotrophicum HRM2]
MKKLVNFLLILAVCAIIAPAANALPYLEYGNNRLYYNNYETVYRADSQGNYYELDYTNPTDIPVLTIGDIFVGILEVQNIKVGSEPSHWSFDPGVDELTGIFAQQITNIETATFDYGPFTGIQGNKITLGLAQTDTFTTLNNDTFTTGLNGQEAFKLYSDDSTAFNTNGTIAEDILTATDGNEWITLGMVESTDYAYTFITPQGTGLDQFIGKSYLGLSVMDYYATGMTFPLLTDPEVGIPVQFYANSELEGNDDYIGDGTDIDLVSPWVFESNDPAHLNAIPEPTTMLLFGVGLLGLSAIGRKKRK